MREEEDNADDEWSMFVFVQISMLWFKYKMPPVILLESSKAICFFLCMNATWWTSTSYF